MSYCHRTKESIFLWKQIPMWNHLIMSCAWKSPLNIRFSTRFGVVPNRIEIFRVYYSIFLSLCLHLLGMDVWPGVSVFRILLLLNNRNTKNCPIKRVNDFICMLLLFLHTSYFNLLIASYKRDHCCWYHWTILGVSFYLINDCYMNNWGTMCKFENQASSFHLNYPKQNLQFSMQTLFLSIFASFYFA